MIHTGDCVTVMAGMPAESVDAVVTDPPYGLEFMGKEWDRFGSDGKAWRRRKKEVSDDPAKDWGVWNRTSARAPHQFVAGTPFQAWCEAWGREALRVTKPGGYLLAFGGTRTHHRLVCGLEDAGWIIRDELTWVYASGFPKGRANLKPAHEPIVLARKPGPLRPLNIEENRIGVAADDPHQWGPSVPFDGPGGVGYSGGLGGRPGPNLSPQGRWPSNLLLSDPELFDEPNPYVVGSGATAGDFTQGRYHLPDRHADDAMFAGGRLDAGNTYTDTGGYSRFFIVPKSDRADREPVLKAERVYCNCETVKPDRWVSEDRKPPERTDTTSPRKGTSEATTTADSDSSTTLFGSSISAQSQPDIRSTTSTATSSTTESPTSSPSIPSPTSDSTPGASSSRASGGSNAPSASSTESSTMSGGTSRRKAGRSTVAAVPATSPESSTTSNCADCGREVKPSNGGPVEAADGVAGARRNSHPT